MIIRQKIHEAIVTVMGWVLKTRNAGYELGVARVKVLVEGFRIAAAGIRSISDILQEGLYMRLITSRLAKYSVAKYYQG